MNPPSQLEILPDELFLNLFSYILPTELYHVWRGLNCRLNATLRSVRISFDLTELTETTIHALHFFSQQIVYLYLHIVYQSLDLKQFPNLRSLTVDTKLTKQQLKAIHPTSLSRLERLTFSEWWKDKEPLSDVIFNEQSSNQQKLSWLKVYHLPSMPNYFLTHTLHLSHIQTMIVDRVTLGDVYSILSSLRSLRRLKVTIVRWVATEAISTVVFPDQIYQHQHLIHLDTTLNTYNKLDDLYPLLSRLPYLRYLHVACDNLRIHDFEQLAFELYTRVPRLERFNCFFKQTYIANVQQLHCMSPLFHYLKCRKVEWNGGWYYYCVTTENR